MSIREETLIECSEKVTHAENKGVSNRLLAKLLKVHGDSPPDAASREAVERLTLRFTASRPRPISLSKIFANLRVYYEKGPETVEDRMRRIVREVSIETGVSLRDIFSEHRSRKTARARQKAMARCMRESGASSHKIGRYFERDPSTVRHALIKYEARSNG